MSCKIYRRKVRRRFWPLRQYFGPLLDQAHRALAWHRLDAEAPARFQIVEIDAIRVGRIKRGRFVSVLNHAEMLAAGPAPGMRVSTRYPLSRLPIGGNSGGNQGAFMDSSPAM